MTRYVASASAGRGSPPSHYWAPALPARHRGKARAPERRAALQCLADPAPEAWGRRSLPGSTARARRPRLCELFSRPRFSPFEAFAKGVRLWREELLAYFEEPTTNGYAEGVINKVKVIKRRAYGLLTFDGFRERVLLACG